MGELIDRQAANEWCTDCKEYDQKRHCCPRWNRVIRTTVEELKAEHRWIPVTDRLPDKKGHYLATNLGRVYITGFNCEVFGLRHVTAWMPLPEPYKGEI